MKKQMLVSVPDLLTSLSGTDNPDSFFAALLPALGETLRCDRCFLYLRNPMTQMGKITHCWLRSTQYPYLSDPDWKLEPASLLDEDPMFAAALRTDPSIFVEDVETASPEIVNFPFERKNFGHRALVHSHLSHRGQLWGILQPCVFGQTKAWTESDRRLIAQVERAITPLAIAYVKAASLEAVAA